MNLSSSPGVPASTRNAHTPRKKVIDYLDAQLHYILIAPVIIILFGLVIYPFIYNLILSVHHVSLLNIRGGEWPFIGFENFTDTLTDSFAQRAFFRTLLFAGLTVVIQLVLGMAAALAFNVNFKGKNFLMPMALAPMMITPVAVGLFWRMLLNSEWGVINYFLSLVGIPAQLWLADPVLAFLSLVIVQVWWGVSFVFLVLLGGLSSLPREPFEAAYIDGASRWQAFRYLTLPMLRPVIVVVATIRIIDAFREFDIIYTLTGGGPGDATRVFSMELFVTAFETGNFGLGAAQALILTAIIVIFTSGLFKNLTQTDQAS